MQLLCLLLLRLSCYASSCCIHRFFGWIEALFLSRHRAQYLTLSRYYLSLLLLLLFFQSVSVRNSHLINDCVTSYTTQQSRVYDICICVLSTCVNFTFYFHTKSKFTTKQLLILSFSVPSNDCFRAETAYRR